MFQIFFKTFSNIFQKFSKNVSNIFQKHFKYFSKTFFFQWSEDELEKLTAKVTPPGKKASQVIQRYCRATKTLDGVKEFTSKKHQTS